LEPLTPAQEGQVCAAWKRVQHPPVIVPLIRHRVSVSLVYLALHVLSATACMTPKIPSTALVRLASQAYPNNASPSCKCRPLANHTGGNVRKPRRNQVTCCLDIGQSVRRSAMCRCRNDRHVLQIHLLSRAVRQKCIMAEGKESNRGTTNYAARRLAVRLYYIIVSHHVFQPAFAL